MSIEMVSGALFLGLVQDSKIDHCDQIRVNIFTMEVERISADMDYELPKEIFVDDLVMKIKSTSAFMGFKSFCHINIDGLRDIARKTYDIIHI